MENFEVFKSVFIKFNKDQFSMDLCHFILKESKGLLSDKLGQMFEVKFHSKSRELLIKATTLNLDAFLNNTDENSSIDISSFLLNRNLPEIARQKSENLEVFYERGLNIIESTLKNSLEKVAKGELWINEPINYRGYK